MLDRSWGRLNLCKETGAPGVVLQQLMRDVHNAKHASVHCTFRMGRMRFTQSSLNLSNVQNALYVLIHCILYSVRNALYASIHCICELCRVPSMLASTATFEISDVQDAQYAFTQSFKCAHCRVRWRSLHFSFAQDVKYASIQRSFKCAHCRVC